MTMLLKFQIIIKINNTSRFHSNIQVYSTQFNKNYCFSIVSEPSSYIRGLAADYHTFSFTTQALGFQQFTRLRRKYFTSLTTNLV